MEVGIGKKEASNLPLFFCLLAVAFILGILFFNLRGGHSANNNHDANAGAVQAAQPVGPQVQPMIPVQPTVYPDQIQSMHPMHPMQSMHPIQPMQPMHPIQGWQPAQGGGHQLYAMPAPGGVRLKTVVDR